MGNRNCYENVKVVDQQVDDKIIPYIMKIQHNNFQKISEPKYQLLCNRNIKMIRINDQFFDIELMFQYKKDKFVVVKNNPEIIYKLMSMEEPNEILFEIYRIQNL